MSIDGRSRTEVPGRIRDPLPMKAGQPESRTHDSRCNGATSPCAPRNILNGTVFAQHYRKHCQEFIAFLDDTAARCPEQVVHATLDNSFTNKTQEVAEWLARHPNRSFRFEPTSSSWLNAVERFLAEHDGRVAEPLRWIADPDEIIAA